jgi:hypothetical protein
MNDSGVSIVQLNHHFAFFVVGKGSVKPVWM